MYHRLYADVVQESGVSARERESALFDRCIEKLTALKADMSNVDLAIDSANFIEKFWLTLVEDLSRPDNALAIDLKASIISIGIFVVKEMGKLRSLEPIDIASLIDISRALRDGLAVN